MTAPTGWLIVQRDLTGSVRVQDAPEVWVTTVFSLPVGEIIGMKMATASGASLTDAVAMAAMPEGPGTRVPHPGVIQTAAELAPAVRRAVDDAGIATVVEEAPVPDWAADALVDLTSHLAGRRHATVPPDPATWSLLHQQTLAYTRVAPWERRADDVHLRLEVRIGSERSTWVAIVVGNAGISRGLVLCPGPVVPPALLAEDVVPPDETCQFFFLSRDVAPGEVQERAQRYGWQAELDVPVFVAIDAGEPREIDQRQAQAVTVALAAAIAHDSAGAGLGMTVIGELTLANGRRGRYRAVLAPNEPLPVPDDVRVLSGEVRDDLIPEGAVLGVGAVPWADLATVRDTAALHHPAPVERAPAGDGLPVLIVGLDPVAGGRVAEVLDGANPDGVALIQQGGDELLVIISDTGFYGVTSVPSDDVAVALFRKRLRATRGWHGIIVSASSGQRGGPIYGFFECVLDAPRPVKPGARRSARQRRNSRRR